MGIFDKLSDLANAATEKTSGAIEIGKLNLRLGGEEKKIAEATHKIGECLLRSLDAGQEYDEAVMSLYEDIKVSRDAVLSIKEEIAALSGLLLCPSCQKENPKGSKFCQECGTSIQEETVVDVTPEAVENRCPSCSAVVAPDAAFCTQCGTKIHED
ncbi:MAG: hypothetical protein H6Q61_807 [Firmicutes bacterium]|nr:hypothetical protein [Bacillota bacterium]